MFLNFCSITIPEAVKYQERQSILNYYQMRTMLQSLSKVILDSNQWLKKLIKCENMAQKRPHLHKM